jgi:pimeloyl-ACP methyl ester carboxylesterase
MLDLKTIQTRHAQVPYLEGGAGDPLLFIHGAGGLISAADPLLNALAKTHHVFAPYLPGYGGTEDCADLRDMLDYTLFGWDLVKGFGIGDPILVGDAMGGMIAAEMAAVAANDVTRLVLIAPAGLWLDDHPVPDLFTLLPYELPAMMFHDVEAGTRLLTDGLRLDDPAFLQEYLIRSARQLGMAGKLLFPVPERGLAQRLYRITAKTVIVWGANDRLYPPVYGDAFSAAIEGSSLITVPDCGHAVAIESPGAVLQAVASFAR